MTTTAKATTTATTPSTDPTSGVEFARVDPRTLIIETNVRARTDLDPAFLASIRTHGVCQPVQARRDTDGNLVVRAGQRRTLAAIETGHATIPVYITDGQGSEPDRIFAQMDENDRRRALSDTDRATAFQQLTLLGVSAAQIAKHSHTKRAAVDAALTVTASPLAAAGLAAHDLTLDQAVVLAEFDDDPDLVTALTAVAVTEPDQFAHTAQRLRDERTAQRAWDAQVADLTAAGIRVIDRPGWDEKTITDLANLTDDAGERLIPETHTACPGRAAHLARTYNGLRVVHVCTNPTANGHTKRSTTGQPATGGPMSDEQKTERRAVIAGNKAWKSAQTVRRDWLRTFAARKTTPKDAPALLAYAITTCTTALTHAAQHGHVLARTTLSIDTPALAGWGGYAGAAAIATAIDTASPARAQMIALVVAVTAIESATGTHTWRNPTTDVARYLTAIASWGYALSEIEQATIDADAAHDAVAEPDSDDTHADDEGDQNDDDDDQAGLDALG